MIQKDRYPISVALRSAAKALDVPPGQVLRKAGLPADLQHSDGRGVTAGQFFALWRAVEELAPDLGFRVEMAKQMAKGPFMPALFAFSCSPDIETGLRRLALFKPLVAPCRLTVERLESRVLEVSITSTDIGHPITAAMAEFELVYFLECCRNYTAYQVIPHAVVLPSPNDGLEAYFGAPIEAGAVPTLYFSAKDASRPLVTENPELWSVFETDLNRQLALRNSATPVSDNVRCALLELLPSGRPTSEEVCAQLNTSKRSLQRHLQSEGQSFQAILSNIRRDLALHYLRKTSLAVEEISYLLAYSDANSFYRAFHGWTGMTPAQAREKPVREGGKTGEL